MLLIKEHQVDNRSQPGQVTNNDRSPLVIMCSPYALNHRAAPEGVTFEISHMRRSPLRVRESSGEGWGCDWGGDRLNEGRTWWFHCLLVAR